MVQPILQVVEVRASESTSNRTGLLTSWHLLSLDAPTVAVVWTWFVARASHVAVTPALYATMFVAVWLLYAVDRLLDTAAFRSSFWRSQNLRIGLCSCRTAAADRRDLEARHLFHHRHRYNFAKAIAAGCLVLAALLVKIPEMLFLLYCGLAGLLLVWFAIIHCFARNRAERLPKELAVGIFFSAAVFLPGWLGAESERNWLVPAAVAFGLLCTLNCLSIYAWEHEDHELVTAHITTRAGVRALRRLGLTLIFSSLGAVIFAPQRLVPVFLATASSAGLLLVLDRRRSDFHRTHLRAASDLALLTPLLIAPFLRL